MHEKKYAYFRIFDEVAQDAGVAWEHIDLFFYRETTQNKLRELVWKDRRLTDFGKAQLTLSKDLICQVDPKVIVVSNALASDIVLQEFPCSFDKERGCHVSPLARKQIPTFLGSMLNGQRAMDRYSRQRLQWHVKRELIANGYH